MESQRTLVHVTHEATGKIGGIGAVLEGFFTCQSYLDKIDRSIIVGPMFSADGPVCERLGENSTVLYSSIDGFANTEHAGAFRAVESYYNAGIIYGHKTFEDKESGIKSTVEVLLFDVRFMHHGPLNEFKGRLFHEFGIMSHMHENLWEFEQYLRLGPPTIAVLKAIGAANDSTTIISHEFMGMPTALAAKMEYDCNFKTVFYAHEVATMRRIVEENDGHDTMFYNAMKCAGRDRLYVNDVFGDQNDYFKHPLVDASKHCDVICAVGDYVADELRFMSPEFEDARINVVYNGIPAYPISVEDKLKSKAKLQQYCENLLGYRPDHVFTHVTRLVQSKGLWRDLQILETIEKEFRAQHKTGVMFLLSTEVAKRPSHDIHHMESAYHWPIAHRENWPDMSGGEANFYTSIQKFNAKSRNIKIVFVNQFGFEQKLCGKKMPEDMEFMDIRKGSDVEFGMSIYEPFGIAQLEPLTFGGICAVSNVCGCAGFVNDVTAYDSVKNVIIADYTDGEMHEDNGLEAALGIDTDVRKRVEDCAGEKIAMQICSRLPNSEKEVKEMIETGYRLAQNMSWDVVVSDYLLPSLKKAEAHNQAQRLHDVQLCNNVT